MTTVESLNGRVEEWRSVPGYGQCYEVSSLGRIRSIPRPRTKGGVLKQKISKRGYPAITLVMGGVQSTHEVHRLVASAFLEDRPEGTEVRHLDGDPLNARLENLAYGTRSENNYDRVAHGSDHNKRKTHCPQGHPYDEANTRLYQGRRYCKACNRYRPNYNPAWRTGT